MGRVRGPAGGRASILGHLREGRRGGGIAVLRYDDRGGGGSTGSVARSTTSDFADDALAGIARLLERADIDPGRIGLVGHSEGAAVASLAASRSDAVRFAVLLGGTSVPGAEVMYEQFAAMEASEDLEPYREELGVAIREESALRRRENLGGMVFRIIRPLVYKGMTHPVAYREPRLPATRPPA